MTAAQPCQVALVTGSSRGIGLAAAVAFLATRRAALAKLRELT